MSRKYTHEGFRTPFLSPSPPLFPEPSSSTPPVGLPASSFAVASSCQLLVWVPRRRSPLATGVFYVPRPPAVAFRASCLVSGGSTWMTSEAFRTLHGTSPSRQAEPMIHPAFDRAWRRQGEVGRTTVEILTSSPSVARTRHGYSLVSSSSEDIWASPPSCSTVESVVISPRYFHLGKGYAHLLCVSHIEPDFALDSKSVDSCLRNW